MNSIEEKIEVLERRRETLRLLAEQMIHEAAKEIKACGEQINYLQMEKEYGL